MKNIQYLILVLIVATITFSCTNEQNTQTEKAIEIVAKSANQWTGIAISANNRMFVNFPKWSENVPISVAEIKNGKIIAFPDNEWQNRNNKNSFIAVQSVFIDKLNRLWVLDTRNPQFSGVKDGGPVLYQFNLENNSLNKVYRFSKESYAPDSYFNDVRIDIENNFAYITDSGNGALIVLNLKNRKSKRILYL